MRRLAGRGGRVGPIMSVSYIFTGLPGARARYPETLFTGKEAVTERIRIHRAQDSPGDAPRFSALLGYPFRPFFLLAGVYAALSVALWLTALFGGGGMPAGWTSPAWHAHEMLFALVPAAAAGFLLTAMSNWTGAPALRGAPLAALALLWIAGRAVMLAHRGLPAALVAAVDVAFLAVLGAYVLTVLVRAGNHRNLPLAAVVLLLGAANAAWHAASAGLWPGGARLTEILALDLIALLIAVIAGRITPAFTANRLRAKGDDPARVRRVPSLDIAALAATAAMLPADVVTGWPMVGGAVGLAAGLAHATRMTTWNAASTLDEPLLWILHLGYAWLAAALVLKGLAPFTAAVPPSAWLHAMGAGAIGTMILGVMTRVSLGHTGRALTLPRGGTAIYALVTAGALLRVAGALGAGPYTVVMITAGTAWAAAFALFALVYAPILCRPRVDGRPG